MISPRHEQSFQQDSANNTIINGANKSCIQLKFKRNILFFR